MLQKWHARVHPREVSSTSIIRDNVIVGNGGDGIDSYLSDSIISNNTVIDNSQYGLYINNNSDALVLRNEVLGNTTGDVYISVNSSPVLGFNTYNTISGTPDASSDYNITF